LEISISDSIPDMHHPDSVKFVEGSDIGLLG
jgi:hypothetical protein